MTDAARFVCMSAKALIDWYGIDAAAVAGDRARNKLAHGDADGARIWLGVRNEIDRLQSLDDVALRA